MSANTTSQGFYGKPGEGRVVRDPAHDFNRVSDMPRAYPQNAYWARRFACGDMIACEPDAPSAKTKPAARAVADS